MGNCVVATFLVGGLEQERASIEKMISSLENCFVGKK